MLRKKIETALEKINNRNFTNDEILTIFQDICFDFNIERFALGIHYGKNDNFDSFLDYTTLSKELVEHYKKNKYYMCDPIFRSLYKVAMPFEWSIEDFDNLIPIQKKLMNVYSDFDIKSGTTIPLVPYPTFHGFVTVLNDSPLHPDVLHALSLIANASSYKIMMIKDSQILDLLTEREFEILSQKSQGQTIKAISHNLDISQSTASFHLSNIRKKLKVQSTEHAVSKFISMGPNSKL